MKYNQETHILGYILGLRQKFGLTDELSKKLIEKSSQLKKTVSNIQYQEPVDSYSRNIIAREYYDNKDRVENFEIIVGNWKPTLKACHIHGHPQFMYYQILSGKYKMNIYRQLPGRDNLVEYIDSIILLPGDVYSVCTKDFTWSNAIHSIECIESGQTLHIYSHDGTRGKIFVIK